MACAAHFAAPSPMLETGRTVLNQSTHPANTHHKPKSTDDQGTGDGARIGEGGNVPLPGPMGSPFKDARFWPLSATKYYNRNILLPPNGI